MTLSVHPADLAAGQRDQWLGCDAVDQAGGSASAAIRAAVGATLGVRVIGMSALRRRPVSAFARHGGRATRTTAAAMSVANCG
jgi:hypothetical protein